MDEVLEIPNAPISEADLAQPDFRIGGVQHCVRVWLSEHLLGDFNVDWNSE